MTRVWLECITMTGNAFALFDRDGSAGFPHGDLEEDEHPAEAARRIVAAWTGTQAPKLELVDFVPGKQELGLVFRAVLTADPQNVRTGAPRGGLPPSVGRLAGPDVEEMLKTSLNYKLTRG